VFTVPQAEPLTMMVPALTDMWTMVADPVSTTESTCVDGLNEQLAARALGAHTMS
jgi:hypothetical protein